MHVLRIIPLAIIGLAGCSLYTVPDDPRSQVALLNSLTASSSADSTSSASSTPTTTASGAPDRNYDVNGDGYDDLLVSATRFSATEHAYVFHGSAAGIASQDLGAGGAADTLLSAPNTGSFGQSVALGDFNGDGFADAVIASRQENANQGEVYIFYSQGAGGIADQDLTAGGSAGTVLIGEAAGDFFGGALAVGDANGDGYQDLLVSATGYNGGANDGRVYLFHGGASGYPSQGAATADTIFTGGTDYHLGGTNDGLALRDVNGDGYSDAIITAFGGAGFFGEVYVFLSRGSSGLAGIDLSAGGTADATITGDVGIGTFGQKVTVGDFNGDGFGDLLVGGPAINPGAYVFHSTGSAGIASTVQSAADSVFIAAGGSSFASTLTGADFDGDGFDDLLIGNKGSGEAYAFYSAGASGVPSQDLGAGGTADTTLTESGFLPAMPVGRGDFNGDGIQDAVLGTAKTPGQTYILYGASGSMIASTALDPGADTILTGFARFGTSVPR